MHLVRMLLFLDNSKNVQINHPYVISEIFDSINQQGRLWGMLFPEPGPVHFRVFLNDDGEKRVGLDVLGLIKNNSGDKSNIFIGTPGEKWFELGPHGPLVNSSFPFGLWHGVPQPPTLCYLSFYSPAKTLSAPRGPNYFIRFPRCKHMASIKFSLPCSCFLLLFTYLMFQVNVPIKE